MPAPYQEDIFNGQPTPGSWRTSETNAGVRLDDVQGDTVYLTIDSQGFHHKDLCELISFLRTLRDAVAPTPTIGR